MRSITIAIAVVAVLPLAGCMDLLNGSEAMHFNPDMAHVEVRVRGKTFDPGQEITAKFYVINDNGTLKMQSPEHEEFQIFLNFVDNDFELMWTEVAMSYNDESKILIPQGQAEFGQVTFLLVDADGYPLAPGKYMLQARWHGMWGGYQFMVRDPYATQDAGDALA